MLALLAMPASSSSQHAGGQAQVQQGQGREGQQQTEAEAQAQAVSQCSRQGTQQQLPKQLQCGQQAIVGGLFGVG